MILVAGGCAETAPVCSGLLERGHDVLVSLATGLALDLPVSNRLKVRRGLLDGDGFRRLLREKGVSAVADVSHPFARALQRTLVEACRSEEIPLVRLERPGPRNLPEGAVACDDHQQAIATVLRLGGPVLLAIGVRNLEPYVRSLGASGIPFDVRILPTDEGFSICRELSIPPERVLPGTGIPDAAWWETFLRARGSRVLVTKEGGLSGGVGERLEGARRAGCGTVLVLRPPSGPGCVATVAELLEAIEGVRAG